MMNDEDIFWFLYRMDSGNAAELLLAPKKAGVQGFRFIVRIQLKN